MFINKKQWGSVENIFLITFLGASLPPLQTSPFAISIENRFSIDPFSDVCSGISTEPKKNKKIHARVFFLPLLHDPLNYFIEIFFEPIFALFGIVSAPVSIALDKPYRISGSEVFHKYFKPPNPDLIERLCFHVPSPP